MPIDDEGNDINEEEMEDEVEEPYDLISKNLSCHYWIRIS